MKISKTSMINRDCDHGGTLFSPPFQEKKPNIRGIANIKRELRLLKKKKERRGEKKGINIFCVLVFSFVSNSSVVSVLGADARIERLSMMMMFFIHVVEESLPSKGLTGARSHKHHHHHHDGT